MAPTLAGLVAARIWPARRPNSNVCEMSVLAPARPVVHLRNAVI